MAKTLLQRIYEHLVSTEKVSTKTEFASKLGYDQGHMSRLLKSNADLPYKVKDILNREYAISIPWMESNGVIGEMLSKNTDKNISKDSPLYEDDLLSSMLTKNDQAMINRAFGIIEESNANMKEFAAAFSIVAKTNDRLTAIIERLVPEKEGVETLSPGKVKAK